MFTNMEKPHITRYVHRQPVVNRGIKLPGIPGSLIFTNLSLSYQQPGIMVFGI